MRGPLCETCVMGGKGGAPASSGFFSPDGEMKSGVMIVAEALGEHEAKQEKALVGPSGFLLGRAFSRKRWTRDEFRYANSYYCKPARNQVRDPKGRLFPWAETALSHCAPYLDKEIDDWKPKAIVALGETALYRLTGESFPITAARGYVFRERKDRCWVVPTYHPAFLLRGQETLTQVLLWDVAKAKRIASEGFEFDHPACLLDPPVVEWDQFVQEALETDAPLAVDIETPFKRSNDEDDLGLEPVDVDMPFRVSFAFGPDKGASVAWSLPYLIGIRKLMTSGKMFIIWNRDFDRPRLEKALGISIPIEQTRDTMVAWHVLFNALPKKLGYATSCLPSSWRLPMWKHLNLTEGAYYSCLRAGSVAVLADGTTKTMGEIVKNRLPVWLRGMDEQGRTIPVKVIGWHKNKDERPWWKVVTEATTQPIYCTNDHKIWSPTGWVEAQKLQVGDRVFSPKPGNASLIHGSILGDGHVSPRGRFTFTHSHPQRGWFDLKADHFEAATTTYANSKYTGGFAYRAEVAVSKSIWRDQFYPNGVKHFVPPPDIAALTVWYLDDGCHALSGGVTSNPRFAAYGFDNYKELLVWFQDRYGAENVSEYNKRPGGSAIALKKVAGDRFFAEIAPYVPPCMEYKLPTALRGRYNGWIAVKVPQETVVRSAEPDTQRRKSAKFCVDVDHPTHRFFTLGGLVKNCMDSIALWRNDFDILALLQQTGQKVVFDNLITAIDPVLERMSLNGMLVDQQALGEFKVELEGLYASLTKEMTSVVPPSVRPMKVWKSERAALKGVELMKLKGEEFDPLETLPGTQKESTCQSCGSHPITKAHVTRKTIKTNTAPSPLTSMIVNT